MSAEALHAGTETRLRRTQPTVEQLLHSTHTTRVNDKYLFGLFAKCNASFSKPFALDLRIILLP